MDAFTGEFSQLYRAYVDLGRRCCYGTEVILPIGFTICYNFNSFSFKFSTYSGGRGMDRRLPVKGAFICAALLFSISCKTRNTSAGVKDAVDSSNALFGTGRSAATRAAKRNCFRSEVFSEDQGGVGDAGDNRDSSASTSSSSSSDSSIKSNTFSFSSGERNHRIV